MKTHRRIFISVAASASLLALAVAAPAQAQDVYWSIGLSSPGVQVGVSSAPPVLVQPVYQPYVRMAPPVLVMPRPVVYARPAPVVVLPAPVIRTEWRHPGRHHGWQHQSERYEGEHPGHGRPDRRG